MATVEAVDALAADGSAVSASPARGGGAGGPACYQARYARDERKGGDQGGGEDRALLSHADPEYIRAGGGKLAKTTKCFQPWETA